VNDAANDAANDGRPGRAAAVYHHRMTENKAPVTPGGGRTSGVFQDRRIEALLLDSGGVLMQPIGGRWNPRADFEANVLAHAAWVAPNVFARGIAAGDRFFAASTETPDFDDYHRAMLAEMGVPATPELLADLVRPVSPSAVLETFPEVPGTLEELRRRGVRMAVVSDAWPNLPELHDGIGIGEFFESYTISAVLGCRKPDPRMYAHASDALGLEPAQCLFVDDDPELVAAAIALGYAGCALLRDAPAAESADRPSTDRPSTDRLSSDRPGDVRPRVEPMTVQPMTVESVNGVSVPCIASLAELLHLFTAPA
jgi:HAD superfamily hydrolase (TIGR01509 family)